MKVRVTDHENLAKQLLPYGFDHHLHCGGQGKCGRCNVKVLSGEWLVNGKKIVAPATVLSCQTQLNSGEGLVEFDEPENGGRIASSWTGFHLPENDEPVIGVDIGTTTVAAVKVQRGHVLKTASCFNAQAAFGDNVVSRISRAKCELSDLQAAVHRSVGQLLKELDLDDVKRIAIAGNTVMTCLFHGIDPSPIGVLPYKPPCLFFPDSQWQGIPLLTMPCISGWVGGDLTAGLQVVQLHPGEMLVDIGTNCEIVYRTADAMLCTAAAAGPAFEGAGLNFGCRAVVGAIDHYLGDGEFSVIGNQEATGLCGSAYVDFLAVERKAGHLSEFGRFVPTQAKKEITGKISVSERDVEQLLKAKAAVWAGIMTVEEQLNEPANHVYLAGGFAQYLSLDNAKAIGMLPDRSYSIVGNTSLAGAAWLAAQPGLMKELEALADLPREIHLNTCPEFEDNFIDGLLLA